MADIKRRSFKRSLGERRYRKIFLIAAEGYRTERDYFGQFNSSDAVVQVKCLKRDHNSSPQHVLKEIKAYLREEKLGIGDEAWLVVDRDKWPEERLAELNAWSKKSEQYGFALSNPKFEYWLLLHFEEGHNIQSSQDCSKRLAKFLPDYKKGLNGQAFTQEQINKAIARAKTRDKISACEDWPRSTGTSVYRLVERICKANTK